MTASSEALILGRKIVLAHAVYNLYDQWSDGEVTIGDITAPLYVVGAAAAFFISDPEMRALGWTLPRRTPHAIALYTGHRILEDAGYYEWEPVSDQIFYSGIDELISITPDWMLSEKGKKQKEQKPSHRGAIAVSNLFSNVVQTGGTMLETVKTGSRRIRLPNYRR